MDNERLRRRLELRRSSAASRHRNRAREAKVNPPREPVEDVEPDDDERFERLL